MKDCPECGGSGEWVNPFNNAASACSMGCKKPSTFSVPKDAFDPELTAITARLIRDADKQRGFINDYAGRVIGGPVHGQTVTCRSSRYEVAVMPEMPRAYMLSEPFPTELPEIKRFTYRRAQIGIDGEVKNLWVPNDWPQEQLCSRVFEELFLKSIVPATDR